jgi:hypothetical protein
MSESLKLDGTELASLVGSIGSSLVMMGASLSLTSWIPSGKRLRDDDALREFADEMRRIDAKRTVV